MDSSNYGIISPQVKPPPPGASSVYSVGSAVGNDKVNHQMDLIKTSQGGSRLSHKSRKSKSHKSRNTVRSRRFSGKKSHMRRINSNKKYRTSSIRSKLRTKSSKKRTSSKKIHKYKHKANPVFPVYFGGNQEINIPKLHVPYEETGAGSQTINGTNQQIANATAVSSANRQYDGCVGKTPEECGM